MINVLNRSISQKVPSQYFPVEGAIDPVQTGDPEHLVKGRFMEKCEQKKKEKPHTTSVEGNLSTSSLTGRV